MIAIEHFEPELNNKLIITYPVFIYEYFIRINCKRVETPNYGLGFDRNRYFYGLNEFPYKNCYL